MGDGTLREYLERRIDRLYRKVDEPYNDHEKLLKQQYLEEIKYLTNQTIWINNGQI